MCGCLRKKERRYYESNKGKSILYLNMVNIAKRPITLVVDYGNGSVAAGDFPRWQIVKPAPFDTDPLN